MKKTPLTEKDFPENEEKTIIELDIPTDFLQNEEDLPIEQQEERIED